MNRILRKLLGVLAIGLSWGPVWCAFFVTLVLIIGIIRPQDMDPGEGPGIAGKIGLLVGFVSGAVFGVILSFAENRKTLPDLALIRVALWGVVAAAVWPLLTTVDNRMIYILCPLGAACASASVAMARKMDLHAPERSQFLRWIGFVLVKPLQAVCASK